LEIQKLLQEETHLKFYSSVRIDIRKTAQIKKGEEVVGSRTKVKIVKNKIAAPFSTTEFDIIYNEGISREGELIALGEKYSVMLQKQGNSYAYGEEKLGRGYDATRTFLRENKKIADKVEKEILKKMKEEPIPAGKQDEGEELEEKKEELKTLKETSIFISGILYNYESLSKLIKSISDRLSKKRSLIYKYVLTSINISLQKTVSEDLNSSDRDDAQEMYQDILREINGNREINEIVSAILTENQD
jgi:hypothetical protein